MYKPVVLLAVLVAVVLSGCSLAPARTIKPLPDFVEAGLEAGDRVVVTTVSGQELEFVVTEIRDNTLVGDEQQIPLAQIEKLQKISWSRPDSPCGGDLPLGCSVPWVVTLASETHAHYEEAFHDACVEHDYCYRHGHRSYEFDREACDAKFLSDMHALCPEAPTSAFGKIMSVLGDDIQSRSTCLMIAGDFHAAVRRYAEKRFQVQTSTYCEYNGPP